MPIPSQQLLASGTPSAEDNGLTLFQVETYTKERLPAPRGRMRRKPIKVEVWASDAAQADALVKACRPDLLMERPRIRAFAPITSDDLGGMRWEEFNQAERECICLAVIPRIGAGLYAYQMPAGKVFMFTVDAFGDNKSISFRGLSRAWIESLWEAGAGNGPVPDKAIWFTPEGKAVLRDMIMSNFDEGKLGL